ncbi:integrin beta-2-like [Sycon ciliatum]|uniref:integrin beta-2-like n=1 Tax=Sycon ciliatum TaxID=27933 RepID=UPI0031F63FAB
MMKRATSHVCTFLLVISVVFIQKHGVQGQDCSSARTCSQCLDTSVACQWCADETEEWRLSQRCQSSFSAAKPCTSILNPASAVMITKDDAFANEVQVRPQRVSVNLRPYDSVSIKAKVKPSRNYPLDVYYLMDHSFSMRDDLDNMKKFASSIAASINNLTTGYRLGYGSFVDKPKMPFVAETPVSAMAPCPNCKVPYSFANSLQLTNDAARFDSAVQADVISGNLDHPEGTLDAIVQAAVCTSNVGWRQNSRRVLLVATDAASQVAGIGKLVGTTHPNPGTCYTDPTDFLKYDFPSISFVSHIIQRERILPIFLIAEEVPRSWWRSAIAGLRDTGASLLQLSKTSDNVLTLLEDELRRLVRVARIVVLPQTGVNISVSATCPGGVPAVTDPDTGFMQCTNLDFDKIAEFDITLTGLKCSNLGPTKQIVVRLVGYGDITVDLSPYCQCSCETTPMANSDFCSKQGSSLCGVCSCNPGFRDKQSNVSRCDCNTLDQTPCIQSLGSPVCGGRGECVCQQCQCGKPAGATIPDAAYSGKFCECDNFNCPLSDTGAICGGPAQGSCVCGKCQCKADYTGSNCGCPLLADTCRQTPGAEPCSGRGSCMCGECTCQRDYDGAYCEKCSEAETPCDRAARCFNCSQASEGKCAADCPGVNPTYSEEDNPTVNGNPALQCLTPSPYTISLDKCSVNQFYTDFTFVSDGGCTLKFSPFVVKACTEAQEVNYVPLTVAPALALLAVALIALILLKGVCYYRDHVEYKKFMKEVKRSQNQGNEVNPIFNPARKVYVNPEYQGEHEKERNGVDSKRYDF